MEEEYIVLENKLKEACHHMLWVWYQYGDITGNIDDFDKGIYFNHKDMNAGEGAGEFLQAQGYVDCGGWCDKLTLKGHQLMNEKF